jgi:hypothetical protein
MMIRRILAGSIVAMLLSVSSLTAACDLSCAFASMNSDCHSGQAESQESARDEMKMDGMAMAGMTMPKMTGGEDRRAVSAISLARPGHPSIGEMGPCERQACDNGSAVFAKTSRSVDSHFHFNLAGTETPSVNIAPPLLHEARDDVASSCPRDGSPLQPSLRI